MSKAHKYDDLRVVRKLFPITQNRIYLNATAIGPLPIPTQEKIADLFTSRADCIGGYSIELHHLQRARVAAARIIGAEVEEIALMPNTSWGLIRAAWSLPLREGDQVLIPTEEFPAPVYTVMGLKQKGVEVRLIECEHGLLTPEELKGQISPKSKALFISWVGFKSGVRQPLAELSAVCRDAGMRIVVDGIQGVGGLQCDVKEMGVDILCTAGPKWLLSPLGIGFMYVERNLQKELSPPSLGWLSVERDSEHPFEGLTDYDWEPYDDARRLEMATISYILSEGMATSIDLLCDIGEEVIEKHILNLNKMLYEALPKLGWKPVLSDSYQKYRSNVAVFLPRDYHRLEEVLEREDITVTMREGSVRIAPHIYNNQEDIFKFIKTCDIYSA